MHEQISRGRRKRESWADCNSDIARKLGRGFHGVVYLKSLRIVHTIATQPRFISRNKIISFPPSPRNGDEYETKGLGNTDTKELVVLVNSEEPSLPESRAVPRRRREGEERVSVLRCRVAARYSREPRDQPCRVSRVCPVHKRLCASINTRMERKTAVYQRALYLTYLHG